MTQAEELIRKAIAHMLQYPSKDPKPELIETLNKFRGRGGTVEEANALIDEYDLTTLYGVEQVES